MPGTRGARRRPASVVALALVLLLAACGEAPPPADAPAPGTASPPALEPAPRLAWERHPASGEPPAPRVLERFAYAPGADELAGWRADTLRVSRQRLPTSDEVVLLLRAPRSDHPLALRRDAPAPDAADVLRLDAAFEGAGDARVELLRDGAVVASGRPRPLEQALRVARHRLALPAERPPHDAVVLRVEGGVRRLGVAALAWETAVPGQGLPEAASPAAVRRGDTWRPAGVLRGGERLRLDAPLPAGRALELHAALPDDAAPVELRLRWRDADAPDDAPWTDATWRVDVAERWTAHVLAPAPRPRAVLLELPGAPAALALVSAPHVPPPAPAVEPTAAAAPAPLVLLMTSGSHRGDHLGAAFRGVEIPTPQLDALAAEGWLFTDAATASNHAVPALAGLHTGLDPRLTGVLGHGQRLQPDAHTLAEAFAAAGYTPVAVLGGSHLAPDASGLGQGFVRVDAPASPGLWPAEVVVERARALLAEHPREPLFLWLAFSDGRWPHDPEPETLARLYDMRDRAGAHELRPGGRVKLAMPEIWREERDLAWMHAHYKGPLVELDAALAPLLAEPRVAAAPRAFVGDHGLALGEHRTWYKPLGLYPGVLHVPLILAAPGLEPGVRRADPVASLDLGRTLLDLAGAAGQPFPGRSLRAPRAPDAPRFAVESDGLSASITSGPWHLVLHLRDRRVRHLPERAPAFTTELYDLRDDWGAERPLLREEPGQPPQVAGASDEQPAPEPDPEWVAARDRLRAALTNWLAAQPERDLAAAARLDPLLEAERLALGYTGPLLTPPLRLLDEASCPWCDG